MGRSKTATSYIFHGSGGAADGAYPTEYLRFISRHTGLEPHELFDFFIGESVTSLHVGALNTEHPDKPERALFTTEELADTFYENIGSFIPYKGWRNMHKLVLGGKYIDRTPLEDGVQGIFGEATIGSSIKSMMITSHKVSPGPRQPFAFTNFNHPLLKDGFQIDTLVDAPDVPTYRACLASMAHGIFLHSYTVEDTGTDHYDFAAVGNRAPEIQWIRSQLDPSVNLAYAHFGCGSMETHHSHDEVCQLDNSGLVRPKKLLAIQQGAVAETKSAERLGIQLALGPENYHEFQMDMAHPPEGVDVPLNPLDTRAATMEKRRDAAQAYITAEHDAFTAFADALGENHALKHQPEPLGAFATAAQLAMGGARAALALPFTKRNGTVGHTDVPAAKVP